MKGSARNLAFKINLTGFCGESVTKKLRIDAFANIMRQDMAFFDDPKYTSGKLCTRFSTDAPNVRYVGFDFGL